MLLKWPELDEELLEAKHCRWLVNRNDEWQQGGVGLVILSCVWRCLELMERPHRMVNFLTRLISRHENQFQVLPSRMVEAMKVARPVLMRAIKKGHRCIDDYVSAVEDEERLEEKRNGGGGSGGFGGGGTRVEWNRWNHRQSRNKRSSSKCMKRANLPTCHICLIWNALLLFILDCMREAYMQRTKALMIVEQQKRLSSIILMEEEQEEEQFQLKQKQQQKAK